jgi:hypothetical protein
MRGYRTKKISLPGGQVIEIVYFAEPGDTGVDEAVQRALEAEGEAPEPVPSDDLPLHVCPECACDLVYPVSWEESSGATWTVERRCPNCEWHDTAEHGDDELSRFDDALNEGTEALLVMLRDTARANMEAAVERMIDAIKLDLIEPMDF